MIKFGGFKGQGFGSRAEGLTTDSVCFVVYIAGLVIAVVAIVSL